MREISSERGGVRQWKWERKRERERERGGGSERAVQIQAEHLSFCYKDYKLQIHLAHDALLLPFSLPHPLPRLAHSSPAVSLPLLFSSSLLSVAAFGASLSRFPFLLRLFLFRARPLSCARCRNLIRLEPPGPSPEPAAIVHLPHVVAASLLAEFAAIWAHKLIDRSHFAHSWRRLVKGKGRLIDGFRFWVSSGNNLRVKVVRRRSIFDQALHIMK